MSDPVYEMFWDCPRCDTAKLLGKTHRHCPNCGAPQDPDARYFPPEDEKVAVDDHVFVGRDRICPYCEAPNGARSTYCGVCGGPLDGSKDVSLVQEEQDPEEEKSGSGTAAKAGCGIAGVVGILLAVVAVLGIGAMIFLSTCTSAGGVEVTGHSWERSIALEEVALAKKGAWCDQMPAKATDVRRSTKVRDTKQVEDGQTCTTKNVDQGDGTFKQVEECKPRYKDVDVDGEWCDFKVEEWTTKRTERSQGKALSPAPSWPEVKLARKGCSDVGCQREGPRAETYTVKLQDEEGDAHTCDLPQDQWAGMAVGSKWAVQVKLTGGIKCGTLAKP